ncbi:Smr/MutS family protein [Variovorax dokdonensis]|uniref:Smr/MutS family protein n=1 Tax=Variovorax dokdonensis TaxID=344883 RepID=A0ABT7N728_9BURK|nr:Smr/MutS family protein [Variovorax dokdonensis]MDM0043737.1 Smr/MutS family protein [Variovorax dokdonensis]
MPSTPRRPSKPTALKSLGDLKNLASELAEQREREAARRAAEAALALKRQAEQNLFARAIGATQPLRKRQQTVALAPEPPAPIPFQHQLDEQRVLIESLSDEFDVGTLLDADDAMSFRRPGIGTDVTRKLRAGEWSIQRELDLHGLRSDEAREALARFIRTAHKHGIRCVRVVHGKGLGSPGKQPVLKTKTQRWLIQKNEVLAFVQAKPAEGGAGALVVLLAPVAR